jgi:O-antigen ligase
VGLAGFVAIGALFFPAYFELVTASLVRRLSTFGTAFTQDVSLINRFYETREVLRQVVKNPILGYGMGTPYSYFYLIPTGKFTMEWAFVHNGYAGLLYKFGLLGFSTMAIFYLKTVWNGIRVIRTANAPRYDRAAALICVAFLISELLVANTSNPWIMSDGNLMIAVTAAIATGARERVDT